MLQPNIFNTIFVFPILNVLVVFYKLFLLIKIPGAFGLAIVALTVTVRLMLHPFFKQQMDTAKKMQDLKPQLDKLNEKFKKDPTKLQQEQLKLYQQAGINPAAGCLTLIIQMPIFIALYNTLSLFFSENMAKVIIDINKVLYLPLLKIGNIDPWFLGFNLALTPEKAKNWIYYSIPVITALLQYLQVQLSGPAMGMPVETKKEIKMKDGKEEKPNNTGDFQKAMNMQMKFIFPLMIGWFSLRLPVGLSLYWNIFSLFSILQYRNLNAKKLNNNIKS